MHHLDLFSIWVPIRLLLNYWFVACWVGGGGHDVVVSFDSMWLTIQLPSWLGQVCTHWIIYPKQVSDYSTESYSNASYDQNASVPDQTTILLWVAHHRATGLTLKWKPWGMLWDVQTSGTPWEWVQSPKHLAHKQGSSMKLRYQIDNSTWFSLYKTMVVQELTELTSRAEWHVVWISFKMV